MTIFGAFLLDWKVSWFTPTENSVFSFLFQDENDPESYYEEEDDQDSDQEDRSVVVGQESDPLNKGAVHDEDEEVDKYPTVSDEEQEHNKKASRKSKRWKSKGSKAKNH